VDGRPLTGWTVLDIDASLVPAHSDKEGAAPNRKGFGLHPILMFCDNTDEHLLCRLRPGSAGANTASDHIEVSTEAIRQLPTRRRRRVLFRADGAGATIEYLRWITDGGGNKANTWQYSVDWTRDEDLWTNLAKVPDKTWTPVPCPPSCPRPPPRRRRPARPGPSTGRAPQARGTRSPGTWTAGRRSACCVPRWRRSLR
jgi:hypothetical protein